MLFEYCVILIKPDNNYVHIVFIVFMLCLCVCGVYVCACECANMCANAVDVVLYTNHEKNTFVFLHGFIFFKVISNFCVLCVLDFFVFSIKR